MGMLQLQITNFSTSLFNTSVFETANSFSYPEESNAESEISFNHRTATSSPSKVEKKRNDLPLRVLIINCQSIKTPGKHAELANIIESTQADIVIGTESWLKPSIKPQEVLPSDFNCYRKARPTGEGGGIFILVSMKYESEEPEELKVDKNCKLVWTKMIIRGSKDLCVGSFTDHPIIHLLNI
jgi:hypothetical protein